MPTLQESYNAAVAAYAKHRYEEAIAHVDRILLEHPNEVNCLGISALSNLRLQRHHIARARAEQILTKLPNDPVAVLRPLACVMEVFHTAETGESARKRYAGIRDLAFAAVAAIQPGEYASGSYHAALVIAGFAEDPDLAHATFRKNAPNAVGINLRIVMSPTDTLRAWCGRAGAPWGELEPARQVEVNLGAYSRQYPAHAFAYGVIPGGEVLSGWDFAVTPDGKVLHDTNYLINPVLLAGWFPHSFNTATARFFHCWPQDVQYIDADVMFLSGPEGLAVGHWLCDFIPRLRALTAAGLDDVKIALPDQIPQKHRDLLALFGVTGARIIECTFAQRYKFRNLVVAQPGYSAEPSPENVRFLAAALREEPPPGAKARRIFLTRGIKTREIVNRDEVLGMLEAAGFEVMDLNETSIADQRAALSATEITVAVYGSDLLACLFMQPDTDFIALDYYPHTDPVTGALDSAGTGVMCSAIGVHFHVLSCVAAETTARVIKKRDRDFLVDCGALKHLIDTIAGRTG